MPVCVATWLTHNLATTRPPSYPFELQIVGSRLHSQNALSAEMIQPIPAAQGYVERTIGGDQTLDITDLFQNSRTYLDPDCSCATVRLTAPEPGYELKTVKLFEAGGGYWFDPQHTEHARSGSIDRLPVRVLIDRFEAQPEAGLAPEGSGAAFDGELRTALVQQGFQIKAGSLADLQKDGEAIRRMPADGGKSDRIQQDSVDFVLKGDLFLVTRYRVGW